MRDRNGNYYLEADFSLVKSLTPYEIPLNCLLSLYKLPRINTPWNDEDIENYSDENQFGFNIYRLLGNKAELSVDFPGEYRNWYQYGTNMIKIILSSR